VYLTEEDFVKGFAAWILAKC